MQSVLSLMKRALQLLPDDVMPTIRAKVGSWPTIEIYPHPSRLIAPFFGSR